MGGSGAVHAIEAIALGFLHDLRSDNDIYNRGAVGGEFLRWGQRGCTMNLFFLS